MGDVYRSQRSKYLLHFEKAYSKHCRSAGLAKDMNRFAILPKAQKLAYHSRAV